MTFYILLSTVSILTAIVGSALIWGFDAARAREIERTARQPAPAPALPAASGQAAAPALPVPGRE
jgi:hypothetical protein